MSLRYEVESEIGSSFQELELAADNHYYAGLELLTHGYASDGIYLLGYPSAEIYLKICYFKIRDEVTPAEYLDPLLQSALNDGRRYFGWKRQENWRLHDLISWTALHRAHRKRYGRPLPQNTEDSLVSRMRRLHQSWLVEMRYHIIAVTEQDVYNVYNDVTWLRDHVVILARR